jgi:hypothetical protein
MLSTTRSDGGAAVPFHRRVAALAVLTCLGGCFRIAGTNATTLLALFSKGHETRLREPLRPIRGGTRVLIFALDGVGRDVLYGLIRDGRMPHVSRLLGAARGEGLWEHGYGAPDVLSILPSATIPAWTSVFTGAPPAETGVPGNEWFAREEPAFYAPVPVTLENRTQAAKLYTSALLSDLIRTPTLYERLPPMRIHVSASPVYRGADLLSVPNLAQFGDLFGAIVDEAISGDVQESARVARETDETSVGSLLQSIGRHGLPDVQTVYFNGIDLLTHHAEHPLEDQRDYLEAVTDSAIGRILDAYRRRGALRDTWVVFVADHGHTPVLADDRHSLGTRGEDEPAAVLRAAGFRPRPFRLDPERDDFQAVLAYQGFAAYVYLADRSTCPGEGQRCDWSRPPRLEEDVLPVVRAFHAASARGEAVPELRGSLDLIVTRVPPRYGGTASVQIYDGERLLPVAEYLHRHPRPDLLRLEERLTRLMIGPEGAHAGDVVLFSRAGTERPIEERFYFGEPETSDHGSPSAQDSRVPLLVARPGRDGGGIRDLVRASLGDEASQLDFAPLVRHLLTAGGAERSAETPAGDPAY